MRTSLDIGLSTWPLLYLTMGRMSRESRREPSMLSILMHSFGWQHFCWRLHTCIHPAKQASIAPRPFCAWKFLCSLTQSQLLGCWLLRFYSTTFWLLRFYCRVLMNYYTPLHLLVFSGLLHSRHRSGIVDVSFKDIFAGLVLLHVHILFAKLNYKT